MTSRQSALQREIKQRVPFGSKSQEAMLGIERTADILRAHFEKLLAPYGVTGQQYNVLRILRGAGAEGLPTLAIADRMLERSPGITRMIDRLERKGWVSRERLADDRRCVVCRITKKGIDLMAKLDGPVQEADASLDFLSKSALDRLIKTLDVIRGELA